MASSPPTPRVVRCCPTCIRRRPTASSRTGPWRTTRRTTAKASRGSTGGRATQTQLVTIVGTPTGGTFRLKSGGNQADLAFNAAAATVQTAIQAWGGVFSTVTVSGSAGGPYTITFPAISSLVQAASAPFTVDQSLLTGGTAATSKATVAASGQGGTDSLIRGVVGDWSQAAYGVGMDITIRVSREGSYFDGTNWHSAFQENLVLLLVEAYFGFVMGSPDAFALLTKGSAAF
jgi:hypothetical protein